ncbi:lipopolysaccharide transport periplasmic protein LptA [Pseudoalteromonas sp. NBT06-2]|uniref:lipopolysaccharide transport periplasmic protein LptA n=1 Tax=Pseudoalteromonas sp. NBT06-2 TaxID=2025950 RepID=UPI000BA60CCF|nr:lipopolysaccharide transport periplasmic protein LptA [Pseudoalteromonas sp. NBT06-2]PAJ72334.1 lipopolysaccharide transport periplasmic protein LptA [Pseudoalteromonas sp. NBT06-2]
MTNKTIYKKRFIIAALALISSFNIHAKELIGKVSISADTQQADLKRNIVIFKNNVDINHTDRNIKADLLEVHRRTELGKEKQILIATGNPATFSGKLKDGSPVTASATNIRYDVKAGTLTFKGNAKINQSGQSMSAKTIVYDHLKELITAKKDKDSDQRVHTVLTPVKKETPPVKNEEKNKIGNH